jgi:hypothetical protein
MNLLMIFLLKFISLLKIQCLLIILNQIKKRSGIQLWIDSIHNKNCLGRFQDGGRGKGKKYVNFFGKSQRKKVILKYIY